MIILYLVLQSTERKKDCAMCQFMMPSYRLCVVIQLKGEVSRKQHKRMRV